MISQRCRRPSRWSPTLILAFAALCGSSGCSSPDSPAALDGGGAGDGDAGDGDGDAGDGDAIDGGAPEVAAYVPPLVGDDWSSLDPASLGWDVARLETDLVPYLEAMGSTGFVVLYRGHIVIERYWAGWDLTTADKIYSAGKSFASMLVGQVEAAGQLDLEDSVSSHLGAGWSQLALAARERAITIRHLLTMTSGLDDDLAYVAPAGERWYYNTPAYRELYEVLEAATGQTRAQVAQDLLFDRIGMARTGFEPGGNTYHSTARDMARFGLLYLNGGRWGEDQVIADLDYLASSIGTSQALNASYGYLFWLNGKSSFVLPESTQGVASDGPLIPEAPADLYAALGLGDKKIYVVPSLDLVVVRHGEPTGVPQLASSSFDNVLWQKLGPIVAPTP